MSSCSPTEAAGTELGRRDFLWRIGGGLGGLAMADLFAREAFGDDAAKPRPEFNGGLHHQAKVKRVI